jgi:hypothetical protein
MQNADGAAGVVNPTQIEATTHRKEGKNAPATKNATASSGLPPEARNRMPSIAASSETTSMPMLQRKIPRKEKKAKDDRLPV